MPSWLTTILNLLFKSSTYQQDIVPASVIPPVENGGSLRENIQLSPHFTLFELTATANASLQQQNRTLTDAQVQKLLTLAQLGETIRSIVNAPVIIHSGYRCPELNEVIPGSSSTSQHPRCEALDLAVQGQSVDDTFNILLAAAKTGDLKFGQLIIEQAQRSYGVVRWVHCSVIGTLDPSKVGQAMKMVSGADGLPHYTLVDKLDFS